MELTFLGYCSNSFSSVNTVSFLINHNSRYSLFECGANTTNNLHQYVSNFSNIDNVFISHSHFDHFLGLPYFLVGRHLDIINRKKKEPDYIPEPLNVYLPKGLDNLVFRLLDVCHSDIKKLSFELIFHNIKEKKIYDGDFQVSAFEVNHTVSTFGFSVYLNNEKVISYSSDTLYNDKIVAALAGSKILIIEGMVPESEIAFSNKAKHATFTQAVNVINTIKPKLTFIVHLQPRYLPTQNDIISSINKQTTTETVFPVIGERYDVLRLLL